MQIITSTQHALVKHITKLRVDRSYRQEHGTAVVEGRKIVQELIQRQLPIRRCFVKEGESQLKGVQSEILISVNEDVMLKLSGLEHPEGVLAEVEIPSNADLSRFSRILALDRINDPGNLGTLIRSAVAFGWEGLYLITGTCDPYNDKALRAAQGTTFQIPLTTGSVAEFKDLVQKNNWLPLVADLEGATIASVDCAQKMVLVLGNETHGPSDAIGNFCQPIAIPMSKNVESLNVAVAGGILMYALRRCPQTSIG